MLHKYILYIVMTMVFGLSLGLIHDSQISKPSDYSYRVSFGVKIGLMPTGEVVQYALVYFRGEELVSIQGISYDQLIKIGSGEWPIPKTLHFHNYFEEKGFKSDTLEDGSIVDFTAAFDSLWKVRFDVHPFQHQLGKGWSQGKFRPSLKQQEFIYNRYGVRGYDQDYFTDTSFFKLLQDVVNPAWISEYKSLY